MGVTESDFDSEAELESWVLANAPAFFGDCICLPKFQISTTSGKAGVPDSLVMNVSAREWCVLECELLKHGVWPHIAEQITRFVVAVQNRETLRKIRDRLFEFILEQNRGMPIAQELGTEPERLLQHLELFIEGVQPSVAIFIDATNQYLHDFAHALEIPTRVYRVKKLIVGGKVEYYSPDHNSPAVSTVPDEKVSGRTQDLDVLDQLGGGASPVGQGGFKCYSLEDGRVVHIKRSKLHERQNYYWYGLNPGSLERAKEFGVTHLIFIMSDSGFATVPIETVLKFCETTGTTKNPDGTVRHFHALISREPEPELYWSQDSPRFALTDYYQPFD